MILLTGVCIPVLSHSLLNHSISILLNQILWIIYIELYLNHIPVCYFVNPCLKHIIFDSVENCGTNRALIFSVVFWFSLMKMFAFVFSVALFIFFFISFKNEARFLHTISNCFSTNRHYPSHCYPPKDDLVELTLMAGFMRLHCPLNIYDRWQWYTEPY